MSKKKNDLDPEESALFRQSVSGSRPIKHDKAMIKKKKVQFSSKKHSPVPKDPVDPFKYQSQSLLNTLSPEDWLSAEDYIHFAREGIQKRVLGKLKRGLLGIEARIDLHRHTGDEALAICTEFIEHCQEQGLRNLLIVHGKGKLNIDKGPVLKNLLNKWLKGQSSVLAFASATPKDGGTGAVYILLKNRKA